MSATQIRSLQTSLSVSSLSISCSSWTTLPPRRSAFSVANRILGGVRKRPGDWRDRRTLLHCYLSSPGPHVVPLIMRCTGGSDPASLAIDELGFPSPWKGIYSPPIYVLLPRPSWSPESTLHGVTLVSRMGQLSMNAANKAPRTRPLELQHREVVIVRSKEQKWCDITTSINNFWL